MTSTVSMLPMPLRRWVVLRLAVRFLRELGAADEVTLRSEPGYIYVDVDGLLFFDLRACTSHPLCTFHRVTL